MKPHSTSLQKSLLRYILFAITLVVIWALLMSCDSPSRRRSEQRTAKRHLQQIASDIANESDSACYVAVHLTAPLARKGTYDVARFAYYDVFRKEHGSMNQLLGKEVTLLISEGSEFVAVQLVAIGANSNYPHESHQRLAVGTVVSYEIKPRAQ